MSNKEMDTSIINGGKTIKGCNNLKNNFSLKDIDAQINLDSLRE